MNLPIRKLSEPAQLDVQALLLLEKFKQDQKNSGKSRYTITFRLQTLKQVAQQCDINKSEAVKEWLSSERCTWTNRTKSKFVDSYNALLKFQDKTWKPPKYQIVTKMPFIPTEQEIDSLINACGKQTSTVLQMLKETAMRIGELVQLKWIDLDTERKTINITPEKGSNPRILPISDKLLAMINKLPIKDRPTIFQPKINVIRTYFSKQRKEIAERFQNPRLKQITFHTFRHWKATMEYHKTKDIMHVKAFLGHKAITSTLIYINIESALFLQANDEWTCKTATNVTEATQLIEAGFDYITEMDGLKLFRKRK